MVAGSRVLVILLGAVALIAAPTASAEIRASCTIEGTPGDDDLVGTPGADVICGRGGDDRIEGRGDDDILLGGRGRDSIWGGSGDDLISSGPGDDTGVTSGGRGDDRIRLGAGRDADATGGPGSDRIWGGPQGDAMTDRSNDIDVLRGGLGSDSVSAFGGLDRVYGGAGHDECLSAYDQAAGDRIVGGRGVDTASHDPGDSTHRVERFSLPAVPAVPFCWPDGG